MAGNFLKLRQFLEEKCPELQGRVTGEPYPIPPIATILLNILGILQLCSLGFFLLGDSFWSFIPFMSSYQNHPPLWYSILKTNGFVCFIFIFFLCPTILTKYATTGAFEVILDGKIIFSKLDTGRFPMAMEVTSVLSKAGLKIV